MGLRQVQRDRPAPWCRLSCLRRDSRSKSEGNVNAELRALLLAEDGDAVTAAGFREARRAGLLKPSPRGGFRLSEAGERMREQAQERGPT